jgi:hypothetical protein
MSRIELDAIVRELHLTQREIAKLMNVAERTVRRWFKEPEKMYGPARETLRAWLKCERNGLDWGNRIGGINLCAGLGITWIKPQEGISYRD